MYVEPLECNSLKIITPNELYRIFNYNKSVSIPNDLKSLTSKITN